MGSIGLFRNFTELIVAIVHGGSITLTDWSDDTYGNIIYIRGLDYETFNTDNGNTYYLFPLCFSFDTQDYVPEVLSYNDNVLLHTPPEYSKDVVSSIPEPDYSISYPSTPEEAITFNISQHYNISGIGTNLYLVDVGIASYIEITFSSGGSKDTVIIWGAKSFDNSKVPSSSFSLTISCQIKFNG